MRHIISILYVLFLVSNSFAQSTVLDEVIAVVGDEIATKSELESKYSSLLSQGGKVDDQTKCGVLEDVLYSKLILNQAKIDSVEITDNQLQSEMDRRMRYFVSQFGSEGAMESFYKKPMSKIKDEMRKSLKEQMLIQAKQSEITAGTKVTPLEVETYYNKIPKDSLPLINSEVEIAQIVAYAPTSKASIKEVRDKLRNYKKRVLEGEKFSTLAVLYSEDQGSAIKGGEIGFVGKAEVEPEFSAAAFALKDGQVSPIVKTRFGYHIIQLIERRGSKVNVRHILLKPKLDPLSMEKAKNKLDSIAKIIQNDSLDFSLAARRYSDDEDTKKGGGIIVNPYTSSSLYPMDDLDPSLFFVIDKMDIGEISAAVQIQDPRSKPGYRLIKLMRRTKPHQANLKDDYQKIKSAALSEKEQESLQNWVKRAIEKTYVKVNEKYVKGCELQQSWLKN